MKTNEILYNWLTKTIIELNLCPYAKKPFDEGKVHICSTESSSANDIFQFLLSNLDQINQGKFETTIIGTPSFNNASFHDFFDLVNTFSDNLENANLSSHFQLVAFHPDFIFEGLEKDNKANLVNRSPVAAIHILKTESIDSLNLSSDEGEKVSLRNEKLLNQLSSEELSKHFYKLN